MRFREKVGSSSYKGVASKAGIKLVKSALLWKLEGMREERKVKVVALNFNK